MRASRLNDLELDGRKVRGIWEIGRDGEIAYRADGADEEIRVKGPILAAEPDALVAAFTVRQDGQTVVARTVKITGRWMTDAKNRIVFEAERSSGRVDRLTFKGTWRLNERQEIVLSRTRSAGRSRRSKGAAAEHEIVFRGRWELSDRHHLVYAIEGSSRSSFRFRGAFQSPSILAKKGEIRFQLGAETAMSPRARTLTLFGAWKFGRDLGLSFELDQPFSKRSVLRFGGDIALAGARKLSVGLRSERGAPLGVELLITREVFRGNGELFARAVRSAQETRFEAGGRVRW